MNAKASCSSRMTGAFDDSCHPGFGDRPQGLTSRGERQVITRDCLGPGPRVFCDLSRQFLGVDRLPAMLGQEELPGHIGPHPRLISSRQWSPPRAGRLPY